MAADALRRRLLAGAALLLAGCASLPAVAPERVHAGRFAATATRDGKSENTSGRFTLSVFGERLELDLATPLGTTIAKMELGPQGALLRAATADGGIQELRGRDAESLAEQALGWPLPVAGLGDWILGRPAAGRPAQVERDGAQPVRIEQDGWTITVGERFAGGNPRLLAFQRPARSLPPAPAITLRLVLDESAAAAH